MCRPLGPGAAGLLLLALMLAPAPLVAQDRKAEEAALVHRLDSLMPLYGEAVGRVRAEEAAERAEALARSRVRTDTIAVGPLRVVTLPDQVGLARRFFSAAWRKYEPVVRGSPALSSTLFVFQRSNAPVKIQLDGNVVREEFASGPSDAYVESSIRRGVGLVLAEDYARTPMAREWRAPGPVGPPSDPAQVYRDLAMWPSKLNRACLDGSGLACVKALGLGREGESFMDWYTPEERRRIALEMMAFDRSDMRLQNECRADVQTGCDQLIARIAARTGGRYPRPPLYEDRMSLVWLALRRGGAGAWSRLLEDPGGPAGEALTHVSGLDLAQLGSAWRSWVVAQRPREAAGFAFGELVTGLWLLLFLALAMRSTRWRWA